MVAQIAHRKKSTYILFLALATLDRFQKDLRGFSENFSNEIVSTPQ